MWACCSLHSASHLLEQILWDASLRFMQKLLAGEDWAESCYMPVHIDVRDVALAHILAAEIPRAHVSHLAP